MATKQRDAVFLAIMAAREAGFEGGAENDFATQQVKTGLMTGEIVHSKGAISDEKVATVYARSLISNWRKKDDRLNGGVKYAPTTKRGPIMKDETLKKLSDSLKSLKIVQPDNMDLITRVESAISSRRELLASQKAATKVQSLDETLAALADLGIEVA